MIIKENLVGQAVRVVRRDREGVEVARGVIRALALHGGAFVFLIEVTAKTDSIYFSVVPGEFIQVSTFDESITVTLDGAAS